MTANRMIIFAALCAAAAPLAAQDEGKNVYDVQFRSLPADVTSLPA